MTRLLALFLVLGAGLFAAENVLIVADEIPAMESLAKTLEGRAKAKCTIVQQTEMPSELGKYSAVVVYIHRQIGEPAEKAFIDYARNGGKLILLHHSIGSPKRVNRFWLPFLGIALPKGDVKEGGYAYYAPVTMEIVNLAPRHYVTTRNVKYPKKTAYTSTGSGGEKQYPAFELTETEVFINHVFEGERTILLGIKVREPKSGTLYTQDRGGWYKKAEKGSVFYFMPGHTGREFEDPTYSQILVNALTFKQE